MRKVFRRILDGEITVKAMTDDKNRTFYVLSDGTKLFTQDHLNAEIGNARTSARTQAQKDADALRAQLEEMRRTAEEKGLNVDALTQEIHRLEETSMTEAQKAERRYKDLETQAMNAQKQLEAERDRAMSLYRNERISTEILNACTKHRAVNPELIVPLLMGNTELRPTKNTKGEVVGHEVVVHFNNDGTKEDLTVDKAVEKMRSMSDRYGCLFLSTAENGSGRQTLHNQSGNAMDTIVEGHTSQAQYNAWAEKQGM